MKIFLFGFLAFSIWSVIATNIYVCRILGLCDEPKTAQGIEANVSDAIANNTLENANAIDSLQSVLLQNEMPVPTYFINYFAFDKSDFNSDSSSEKYLEESKIYLEQNEKAMLSIAGHTDAVGTDEYNMALGYRRAQRLQLYFENNGVLASRIILESYGERDPADDNRTPEGRANNRRTVITIKK